MIATSLAEAARLLRSGETSAVDLLSEALATASRTEAQLHAFLTIDTDGARVAAGQADAVSVRVIWPAVARGVVTALPASAV